MKLYRFSPIKSESELHAAIVYMHTASHQQCVTSFGEYLPVAGNVGIFCHYQDEYEYLLGLREHITEISDNWSQKYFKLHNPIIIPSEGCVPEAVYEYLYIRKPDPYRHHIGDIDFFLEESKYRKLKQEMLDGKK